MSEAKAETTEKKKGSGGGGKLLLILFAVINLAALGGGVYLVYNATMGWKPPEITEESLRVETKSAFAKTPYEGGPLIYTLEKFSVNLGGEPRRSLRLEVHLEMMDEKSYEEVMNPNNRAPLRDRILKLLNERSFSELESLQGKLALKSKIALEVNSLLKEGVVKEVYFTEFIVQ